MFPALMGRWPAYARFERGLANDHLRLDSVIDGLDVALRLWCEAPGSELARGRALDLANHLHDLMAVHLDLEDADVLPMIATVFIAEEYADLEARLSEDLDLRQALFTVPWFMITVDPGTAARTLAGAPAALKVVFRLTWRRNRSLAERAFA